MVASGEVCLAFLPNSQSVPIILALKKIIAQQKCDARRKFLSMFHWGVSLLLEHCWLVREPLARVAWGESL